MNNVKISLHDNTQKNMFFMKKSAAIAAKRATYCNTVYCRRQILPPNCR